MKYKENIKMKEEVLIKLAALIRSSHLSNGIEMHTLDKTII